MTDGLNSRDGTKGLTQKDLAEALKATVPPAFAALGDSLDHRQQELSKIPAALASVEREMRHVGRVVESFATAPRPIAPRPTARSPMTPEQFADATSPVRVPRGDELLRRMDGCEPNGR